MKRWGYRYVLIGLIIAGASIILAYNKMMRESKTPVEEEVIYLPLGDSYTIGSGLEYQDNFPSQLVRALNAKGIKLTLPVNPARGGSTTFDVISEQLPQLQKEVPGLVTLLVGVNDLIRGVEKETYHKNLETIINSVQESMRENRKGIILITLPDFSVTPSGKQYAEGRGIVKGLEEFNEVIKVVAQKFNLHVADIYPVSKNAVNDTSLTAADGLHPSAKGYSQWVEVIVPEAKSLLTSSPE